MDSLQQLAKQFLLAKSAFNKAYLSNWLNVKPVDDATGWKILAHFREKVSRYVFDYKRGAFGVEQAAWEIFRLSLVGSSEFTESELNGFVKWYSGIKHLLARGIADLYEFHGDGFADTVDGLPLANPETVKRACLGEFANEQQMNKEIASLGDNWVKFIRGENYIETALERAAYKAYIHFLLRDEEVFETGEERELVGYQDYYDN